MKRRFFLLLLLFIVFSTNLVFLINIKKQENNINSLTLTINDIKTCSNILNNYNSLKNNINFKKENENINNLIKVSKIFNDYEQFSTIYNFDTNITSINKKIEESRIQVKPSVVISQEDYNTKVLKEIQTRGTIGRLIISDVGIDVALFNSGFFDPNCQNKVDAKDSAAWLGDLQVPVIADHKHQGFSGIKKSIVGESVAYINYGDRIESYTCIKKCNGTNDGSVVRDDNGQNIANLQEEYGLEIPYIAMYTCNENWQNVTITIWRKNI